ncbi:hypothetical protein [Candidatus Nitrospira nitrificans]|uniref:hypothetical protein n=1 Tax=Candidatus Nitrospira nitrificans TaxID=1742973 RepID=UPI000ACC52C9|nr:hypothetical protein [Candidatus Nitrospira nitrificans]
MSLSALGDEVQPDIVLSGRGKELGKTYALLEAGTIWLSPRFSPKGQKESYG